MRVYKVLYYSLFLALESKLQELMNVCKTGLQEASEIQNEVISAVKKHAQALQTAMDDKTDVSMMVLLLINNLFLTNNRDCTGRKCALHFCWNFNFSDDWVCNYPGILPFNLILYHYQDVYMYNDNSTNQIFVAFIGKFCDNSDSSDDQSFGFLFVDLE